MQVCRLLMFMKAQKFPTYDKQPLTAKMLWRQEAEQRICIPPLLLSPPSILRHVLLQFYNFCLNHDLGGFQGFI